MADQQPGRQDSSAEVVVIDLSSDDGDGEQHSSNQNNKIKSDPRDLAICPSTGIKSSAPPIRPCCSPIDPSSSLGRGSDRSPAVQNQAPAPVSSPVVAPLTSPLVALVTSALQPLLPNSTATAIVPTPGVAIGSAEGVRNPSPEQVPFVEKRIGELESELKIARQKYEKLEVQAEAGKKAFEESEAKVRELTTTFENTADCVTKMAKVCNQYKADLIRAQSDLQEQKTRAREVEDRAVKAEQQAAEKDAFAKRVHHESAKIAKTARERENTLKKELDEAQTRAASAERAKTDESVTVKKLAEELKKLREENELAAETVQELTERLIAADRAKEAADRAKEAADIFHHQELAAKEKKIENLETECKIAEATKKKAADRDIQKARAIKAEHRAESYTAQIRELKEENADYCNRFRQQEETMTRQATQIKNLEIEKNKQIEQPKRDLKHHDDHHHHHRRDSHHHRRDSHRGRNGQPSEIPRKRPREADRDYDNRSNVKRNNNNDTSRGGDLRESRHWNQTRLQNSNPHNNGSRARRSSSSRSPPATSKSPAKYQNMDDYSQPENFPVGDHSFPATDPRTQPKNGQNGCDEKPEEGECPAKRARVSEK